MEKVEKSYKFDIGDYVRWPIGVAIFAASSDGEVNPVEMNYSYGIIVDVARGEGKHEDVDVKYFQIIIYKSVGLNCKEYWYYTYSLWCWLH